MSCKYILFGFFVAIEEADVYIKDLLLKMTEMGAAMRSILSDTLTNPNLYSSLANGEII